MYLNTRVAVAFPVAHIQGTKMIKRNLHFKAPLVFMGGTLVKKKVEQKVKNQSSQKNTLPTIFVLFFFFTHFHK